jgi:hypothetical protein
MSYMVQRTSNTDGFQHWSQSRGNWSNDYSVGWVIEPQWDLTNGRLEAVIPISAFSSGSPNFGDAWADVLIVLASYNTSNGTWQENDSILIHYRLSTANQNWIYGNIEQ